MDFHRNLAFAHGFGDQRTVWRIKARQVKGLGIATVANPHCGGGNIFQQRQRRGQTLGAFNLGNMRGIGAHVLRHLHVFQLLAVFLGRLRTGAISDGWQVKVVDHLLAPYSAATGWARIWVIRAMYSSQSRTLGMPPIICPSR